MSYTRLNSIKYELVEFGLVEFFGCTRGVKGSQGKHTKLNTDKAHTESWRNTYICFHKLKPQ
jgi:hypothetical protein